MGQRNVDLKCPNCGEERIVEWTRVLSAQDLGGVVRLENGELEVTDWGATEVVWEDADYVGYSCSAFCESGYFPLEYFVVNNA